MFIGLIAADWLPVPSPDMTAVQVADMYRRHLTGIRFFSIMNMIAAGWSMMWISAISSQLKRAESNRGRLWTYLQLTAGCCGSFLFLVQGLTWTVAAFRPDRDPEITQALNDMAFVWFLMPFVFATVGSFAIGCCILEDHRSRPVFPRWVGWANIWFSVAFPPAMCLTYFKTGPFAWSGMFPFWIPLVDYCLWSLVMSASTARAIREQFAGTAGSSPESESPTPDLPMPEPPPDGHGKRRIATTATASRAGASG
jgi:hypothetical protein